ncbi:uncharacterized protein LOC113287371 isoform X2 [Papaver somniferum]|uniref:uncharacterized protein LOC113287371 isoform X2 n=1 Tax=Papaver somniferum TaxID=3469 RepID=UPI000E702D5C|nr:uncharacterized protein LOC113287371 isoform X2 [Papaver somniferum]
MHTLVSPSVSSSDVTESNPQTPKPTPSIPSPSVIRLWRPSAQRNLRNQWSKLVPLKQKWSSASSSGRTHATNFINSYLSRRHMPGMNLGVLKDMPNIRETACIKLVQQQELHQKRLLSSYREMAGVVSQMISICNSMRSFVKGPTGSPLIQYSSNNKEDNDNGDCGGIPVFKFFSISDFENLAKELVQMFGLELILKTCEPLLPRIAGWKSSDSVDRRDNTQPDPKTLEVFLTIWLQEVNIHSLRIDDIFIIINEELKIRLV